MIKIIATGPMMKGNQEFPHQVVLRVRLDHRNEISEFIVHLAVYEGEKCEFSNGDYYPVYSENTIDVYHKALTQFVKRVQLASSHILPFIEL